MRRLAASEVPVLHVFNRVYDGGFLSKGAGYQGLSLVFSCEAKAFGIYVWHANDWQRWGIHKQLGYRLTRRLDRVRVEACAIAH